MVDTEVANSFSTMEAKSVRMLFILHLPPPVHGSSVVGQQIRQSGVIPAGWDPTFINLNTSPSTDAIGRWSLRKLFTYAGILLRTLLALIFQRPQLAYLAMTVKGGAFLKDTGVVFLIKLFRVPIVYHLHNKGVANCQHRWPYRWIYPCVFRNCRVILLSKHLYPDVSRFVPENAVEICPNGLPDTAGRFSRQYESGETPVILFLSNLIESKGVFILLEACALLKKRGVVFRAEFIGGEADVTAERFAQRVRELALMDEVAYLGRRYGADKAGAFEGADVFAFPTHYETFGLVNLEAMQYRLPIVTTPEGGIPDVVVDGENGFLVPQRDATALADKLETLLKNPELRQKMGEAGRKRYEAHFTAERFEQRMREILEKAVLRADS